MRRFPAWALALSVLVLAAYAVPYLALSGSDAWSATFLFWIVFGLCVWVVLVAAVMRWRLGSGAD